MMAKALTHLKLKVCGMRDQGNIREVAALGPDLMGFIFFRGTPRYVGDDFRVPDDFPAEVRRVGVFVNETTERILEKVRTFRLDYVQLHGGESPQQCRALHDAGARVIKVFSVDDETDFGLTQPFTEVADYFLFDTKGRLYGGNAKRFNWDILKRYDQRVPFFLSGGIAPEHIAEIRDLSGLNLAAIDVNSGVELAPGVKDASKVKAIKVSLNTNE